MKTMDKLKSYNIKVLVSMDVLAENEDDALETINEMDYNFLNNLNNTMIQKYEIVDSEISHVEEIKNKIEIDVNGDKVNVFV